MWSINNCQKSDKDQLEVSSIEKEQYGRKIYKWYWDETDWKDDQVWWEKMNELTESAGDVRMTEDKMDDQNEVFCVWEKWFCIESSD